MITDKLRSKLEGFQLSDNDVESILSYTHLNMRAFTFANETLENLEIFIVLKNTGGYKLFKRVKGFVIVDKLDSSYQESREIVCIGDWNIKKIIRVRFDSLSRDTIEITSVKDLHKVLFTLKEPTNIKYVVGIEEGGKPVSINTDTTVFKGLRYDEIKDCIDSAYRRVSSQAKGIKLLHKPLGYYVVDYSINNKD